MRCRIWYYSNSAEANQAIKLVHLRFEVRFSALQSLDMHNIGQGTHL